jgi:hypothetical protein
MKSVDLYAQVRFAVQIEELSRRAAARRFGIDPRTVAKMLAFSVPPGYRRSRPPTRPKLDPFIGIIDAILATDEGRPKKQRHTAKRTLNGFVTSMATVAGSLLSGTTCGGTGCSTARCLRRCGTIPGMEDQVGQLGIRRMSGRSRPKQDFLVSKIARYFGQSDQISCPAHRTEQMHRRVLFRIWLVGTAFWTGFWLDYYWKYCTLVDETKWEWWCDYNGLNYNRHMGELLETIIGPPAISVVIFFIIVWMARGFRPN